MNEPLLVADTGPIQYLIQTGCVAALPGLAESVLLPTEVLGELRAGGAPPEVQAWARCLPDWAMVETASDLIPQEPVEILHDAAKGLVLK